MTSSCTSANVCSSSNAAPASMTTGRRRGRRPAPTKRPVAERRPQPLAAGADEVEQGSQRRLEVGVDPGPAVELPVDQVVDARFDRVADLGQARGGTRAASPIDPVVHWAIVGPRPARSPGPTPAPSPIGVGRGARASVRSAGARVPHPGVGRRARPRSAGGPPRDPPVLTAPRPKPGAPVVRSPSSST